MATNPMLQHMKNPAMTMTISMGQPVMPQRRSLLRKPDTKGPAAEEPERDEEDED